MTDDPSSDPRIPTTAFAAPVACPEQNWQWGTESLRSLGAIEPSTASMSQAAGAQSASVVERYDVLTAATDAEVAATGQAVSPSAQMSKSEDVVLEHQSGPAQKPQSTEAIPAVELEAVGQSSHGDSQSKQYNQQTIQAELKSAEVLASGSDPAVGEQPSLPSDRPNANESRAVAGKQHSADAQTRTNPRVDRTVEMPGWSEMEPGASKEAELAEPERQRRSAVFISNASAPEGGHRSTPTQRSQQNDSQTAQYVSSTETSVHVTSNESPAVVLTMAKGAEFSNAQTGRVGSSVEGGHQLSGDRVSAPYLPEHRTTTTSTQKAKLKREVRSDSDATPSDRSPKVLETQHQSMSPRQIEPGHAEIRNARPETERALLDRDISGNSKSNAEGPNLEHSVGRAPHSQMEIAPSYPATFRGVMRSTDIEHSELRIDLRTEEAGSIELRTTLRDGQTHAQISVERSEVRNAMIAELGSLHNALKEQMVEVAQLQITGYDASGLSNGGAASGGQHSREEGHPTPPLVTGLQDNRADIGEDSAYEEVSGLSVRA